MSTTQAGTTASDTAGADDVTAGGADASEEETTAAATAEELFCGNWTRLGIQGIEWGIVIPPDGFSTLNAVGNQKTWNYFEYDESAHKLYYHASDGLITYRVVEVGSYLRLEREGIDDWGNEYDQTFLSPAEVADRGVTVDITTDNMMDYFEVRDISEFFTTDSGRQGFRTITWLVLKEEYGTCFIESPEDFFAIELTFDRPNYKISVDFDSETYELLEKSGADYVEHQYPAMRKSPYGPGFEVYNAEGVDYMGYWTLLCVENIVVDKVSLQLTYMK